MANNKIDNAHHEDWLRQDETKRLLQLLYAEKVDCQETMLSWGLFVSGDAIKTHENTVRENTNFDCLTDIIDLIQEYERWE